MRYYHKKQLIALQRALIKLTTYYGQQSVSNVMDTVDSCYSLIDSLDVVNKETLAFTLTNVRDTLSDVSKRAETKRLSAFNGVNQLFTHISEIKRCISEEDVEFEIVFFPYKASMWDCMESVWREVKKNKNCKCSVIPVPYYKLDKDGNNTEFCYEGEKFPDEVPIVSYSEYNLEEQHPDIVYFHNPYDQYNLVTRVLDEYFSSNLKKYTEKLVYIPYYVAGSYDLTKQATLLLPSGLINSDRVIVQSEYHKKTLMYLGIANKKIVPLGSPKFDKTLLELKNQYVVPSEWKRTIQGKKVFLWNTSIETMINQPNWIEMLSKVIHSFLTRNDCILLWRPHPLLLSSIRSMRTNYEKPYLNLIKTASSLDNVIIDHENDVYTAMRESDALISDYSSIMIQYSITGKPILCLTGTSQMRESKCNLFDYWSNYFLNDGVSVDIFCDMVLQGKDPKKQERIQSMKKSVVNLDGSCGKHIHEYILNELVNSID